MVIFHFTLNTLNYRHTQYIITDIMTLSPDWMWASETLFTLFFLLEAVSDAAELFGAEVSDVLFIPVAHCQIHLPLDELSTLWFCFNCLFIQSVKSAPRGLSKLRQCEDRSSRAVGPLVMNQLFEKKRIPMSSNYLCSMLYAHCRSREMKLKRAFVP